MQKTDIVTVKSVAEILYSMVKKTRVLPNKARTTRVLSNLLDQFIAEKLYCRVETMSYMPIINTYDNCKRTFKRAEQYKLT